MLDPIEHATRLAKCYKTWYPQFKYYAEALPALPQDFLQKLSSHLENLNKEAYAEALTLINKYQQ